MNPAGADRWADLRARIVSGLTLGLAAGAALWAGGWWTALLAAAAGAAMGWEYRSIVTAPSGGFTRRDAYFPAIVALAPLAAHVEGVTAALALLLGGAVAALGLDRGGGRDWRWTVSGLAFLGIATASFVMLRNQPQYGFETVVWLVLVVAAADMGGYFAGRLIGGPKLAPRLSPSKTWAGVIGGLALAFAIGAAFSGATTGTYVEEVGVVSLIAALVAQAGDLAESAIKRRFGVKDASRLIPGHGGALDRLDGLMAATLVAAAVTFARGKEVFVW